MSLRNKKLFELVFYWTCGLLSIILGIISYRYLNRWVGISGIITGFAEMVTWTSPLFRHNYEKGIYDILLTTKLALSITSSFLLVLLWLLSKKFLVFKAGIK